MCLWYYLGHLRSVLIPYTCRKQDHYILFPSTLFHYCHPLSCFSEYMYMHIFTCLNIYLSPYNAYSLCWFFYYYVTTWMVVMLQERVMLALENAGLFKAGYLMKGKVLLKFMACTLKIYLMDTYKSWLFLFWMSQAKSPCST